VAIEVAEPDSAVVAQVDALEVVLHEVSVIE